MKFLKAVRLDASDTRVYSQEGAAQDGEWLVSGGYAVCDPSGATHRKPNCHCLTSFIGVVSRGRCTVAEVVEIDKVEYQQVIERLVRHFVDDLGAPTLEAARAVAGEEVSYTAAQARTFMHRKGAARAIFFERYGNTMKDDRHGRLGPKHPRPY